MEVAALFASVWWIFFVLVNALAPVTRRCRARLAACDTAPPTAAPTPVVAPPLPPIPAHETMGFYLRLLLSVRGVLGAVFVVPLVAFFPLNSRILAENFSVLLDRAATVLVDATLAGWSFEVTDMQLYGMTLSIALLLTGAAMSHYTEAKSRARWLVLLFGLLPIVVFEVGLAVHRALRDGGSAGLASLSGLQAWICAVMEFISAHFAIHACLVPALLAVGWGVVTPCRWLFRTVYAWRHRPRPVRERWVPGLLTRMLAYLDEAFMDPLRALDAEVSAVIAHLSWSRKGAPDVDR